MPNRSQWTERFIEDQQTPSYARFAATMQWRQKFLQSGKKEDPAKGISFHSSVRRAHPT
jgi:hypothetical protein